MIKATLATEDRRFFEHFGVDVMKVLQIKRIVNDASREPDEGQEYEPRR